MDLFAVAAADEVCALGADALTLQKQGPVNKKQTQTLAGKCTGLTLPECFLMEMLQQRERKAVIVCAWLA